jgi:hypothetical protein
MADQDLTTLDAVKLWLAIPSTQPQADDTLAGLITSTSADFMRATGRTDFLADDYAEIREGDGGQRLVMRHWPINTVGAPFKIGAATITESADQIAPGYYFDEDLDPERRNEIYLVGYSFTDGALISIPYNAGYETPPADVRQAVTEWVAARYKGRPGAQLNSQREAGGEHVTYDREAPMPPTTAAVAERYKRCWPSLDKRNDDRDYRVTRINKTYTTTEKAQ